MSNETTEREEAEGRVMGIVHQSLTVNSRSGSDPTLTRLNFWVDELREELGDIDPDRLRASMKAAWKAHRSTANVFGSIVASDVVEQYRRGAGQPSLADVMPADCDGCREGLVTLYDERSKYTSVVPCDCSAGETRRRVQARLYNGCPRLSDALSNGKRRVKRFEVVA